MTKYAILILVTSMLLSCENASSLLKKECNITTAQQSVWALPEVQAKIEQSKALSGKERIQYTQDTIVVLKNTYYRIKLRYNLSYTQLPIATYLVAKNNCNEIFITTPAKELIPYTTYQQQQAQQAQQQKKLPHLLQSIHRQYALQAPAFSRPTHHAHHYPRWQPDSARRTRTYYKEYQRVANLYFYLLPR